MTNYIRGDTIQKFESSLLRQILIMKSRYRYQTVNQISSKEDSTKEKHEILIVSMVN